MPTYQGQIDEEQMLQSDRLREVARLARKDERQMSTAIADIHQIRPNPM